MFKKSVCYCPIQLVLPLYQRYNLAVSQLASNCIRDTQKHQEAMYDITRICHSCIVYLCRSEALEILFINCLMTMAEDDCYDVWGAKGLPQLRVQGSCRTIKNCRRGKAHMKCDSVGSAH